MQQHEEALANYVEDFRDARADALAWWARLESRAVALGSDATSTDEALRPYLPMGPASHPRVLQVLRLHTAALVTPTKGRPGHESHARERMVGHLRTTDPTLGAFLEDLLLFPDETPLPDLPRPPESALQHPRAFRFELVHTPSRGLARLHGASRLMPRLQVPAAPANTPRDASEEHQRLFYA